MNGEPKAKHHGMGKNRIEALADGIFAVAMTLLVLDIKSPEQLSFATDRDLIDYLATLEHSFAMYAISFVVLGLFWFGHHLHFHFVRQVDRSLLWINLLFLLFTALIPFSTDLLGDHGHLELPVVVYGANLLVLAAMASLHLRHLAANGHLAAPELTPNAVAYLRRQIAVLVVVPVASIAASFYSPRLGMYLYVLLAVPAFMPGRIDLMTRVADGAGDPTP
jgi:uncharacterized membrane protein